MASYLNPVIKNAYKPFGWGVDEAVEALEESARDGGGGGDNEAGLPHVLPPSEEDADGDSGDGDGGADDDKEKEEKDGEGGSSAAASVGADRDIKDPEEAALAYGAWHQHGTKRKLNRLPGAKEPVYPACYPPSKSSPG